MTTCRKLATYSPLDIKMIITGTRDDITHIVSGYAENNFIEVTRTTPASELYNGSDNTSIRTMRGIRNHEITLTLHQGSESNDVLSQLHLRDEQTRGRGYLFNVQIVDQGGRTLLSASQCFIANDADVSYGSSVNERVWVINAVCVEKHVGGNAEITDTAVTTLTELGYEVDDYWRS